MAKQKIVVFVIDDAQYIDSYSWELFERIYHEGVAFTVMTIDSGVMTFQNKLSTPAQLIMNDRTILKVNLSGLNARYLAAFACQILGVQGIPKELEK